MFVRMFTFMNEIKSYKVIQSQQQQQESEDPTKSKSYMLTLGKKKKSYPTSHFLI